MYKLIVENNKGDKLQLSQNESNYQILKIDGLNPPKAEIYTNTVATMDGERFKSSKMEMRNIVIKVKINGDIEQNRIKLYRYFGSGKYVKLYFSNGTREVYIEGYCENIDCGLFDKIQEMQISVVCTNPYFKSVEVVYTDNSVIDSKFIFPFAIAESGSVFSDIIPNKVSTIENDGEIETGAKIKLRALADNIQEISIYNFDTGAYLAIDETLNRGDVIDINTYKGTKSITKTSNGIKTNIINKLLYGSTWLQLEAGLNNFTYEANKIEDLQVIFEFNHQYEGV